MTSGEPQGSNVGLLLYIIFMNLICRLPLSSGSNLILYADYILLYKPINSDDDPKSLQRDVDSIIERIRLHSLTSNHNKIISFSVSQAHSIHFNIAGHQISQCPSVKYLSVTLTSNLTWSEHIEITCKAVKCVFGIIYRKLHQAPTEACHWIVNTAILPNQSTVALCGTPLQAGHLMFGQRTVTERLPCLGTETTSLHEHM